LQAADLPTGQKTPEGVACDAVRAYINTRLEGLARLRLVRPIYGDEATSSMPTSRKQMADGADKAKDDKSFKPPRIVKCTRRVNSA